MRIVGGGVPDAPCKQKGPVILSEHSESKDVRSFHLHDSLSLFLSAQWGKIKRVAMTLLYNFIWFLMQECISI